VIDAYRDYAKLHDFIVGRMSDDERRAFEDRLEHDPSLVHELEQSLRIREGLQRLRSRGYFEKSASRRASSWTWIPALAAAACAGLALFLWLSRVTGPSPILLASLESRTAADVKPLVAANFTFVRMRGSSTPDLHLPSAGLIEIRIAPSTRETVHRYHVILVRQKESGVVQPVASVANLALSTDGYVHCYANASRLAPGSYVLSIQPDTSSSGTPEVFPFNLRADVTGSSR
jgi:anti-sigma-K factor RskA